MFLRFLVRRALFSLLTLWMITSTVFLLSRAAPTDAAQAIGLFVGITAGVLSATRARSLLDRATTFFVLAGVAMPTFLLGLLMSFVFLTAIPLGYVAVTGEAAPDPIFEPGPYEPFNFQDPEPFFKHLVMPWVTLATVQAAVYTRLT